MDLLQLLKWFALHFRKHIFEARIHIYEMLFGILKVKCEDGRDQRSCIGAIGH